jgi:hypothetical protein
LPALLTSALARPPGFSARSFVFLQAPGAMAGGGAASNTYIGLERLVLVALLLSWTPPEERTKTASVVDRGDASGAAGAGALFSVAFMNQPAMTVGRFGERSPSGH